MDNYRPIQGQDYGILRKKEGKEEELFVFGYSCKVYEDYDKSLYVDQGKHLIPWLGDETLKIDRYDCRGALNDLTKYLPKSESFDLRANLSNEEKRIEQLCDQERYRALTTNEEEEILLQEEELKRLQQALNNEKSYGEVCFTYDNDSKPSSDATQKEINTEEDDEAFIPPYQLDVPLGMKIPKSKKHHEIIERTAFFIHDQGSQMEILLKIKQAENPQFNFLSFDNELHPYYRHLLMAVKNQRYKPTQAASPEKEKSLDTSNDDTYLHPSLIQNSQPVVIPESASKIPNITYKPSTDCTYSALVNRIKETQTSSLLEAFKKKFSNDPSNTANNNSSNFKNDNGTESTSSLPLSALTKSARRRRIRKEKHKAAAASFKIYYAEEEVKNVDEDEDEAEELENKTNQVEISEATKNADTFNTCVLKPVPAPAPIVELPPSDVQLIIDKMASYVAKNGRDFEDVVRNKGDPRFLFLNKTHVYNAYYNQKVELYLQLENPQIVPVPVQKPVTEKPPIPAAPKVTDLRSTKKSISKSSKSSKSKQPIPICFSIKKPKDQEALEIKSALPYEESEGEDDEENEDSIREKSDESVDEKVEKLSQPEFPESPAAEQPKQENTKKASDMTLEKWAQERLRAKLVTAAKEKLAAKAAREKDKQLQAERRKKAAEFINLLQKDNLVNRIQASEGNFSTSNGKKDISDVITIPSDSSASDSDSIISVPLSEEEEKQQQIKRKIEESNREIYEKTKRKFTSYAEEKSKYMRTKHRDHADDHNNSPPYSKHSHSKYKKYDKEKKTHSKKKKHRHSRNDLSSSSSNKKSHKDHHKSKRSRYASDDTDGSDSSASYSSVDGKK